MPTPQNLPQGLAVLSVQDTPNPNARKFILNKRISETPASFFTPDSAAAHPLASKLFAIPGVSSLLILHDFVTINRLPNTPWPEITPKAKKILREF